MASRGAAPCAEQHVRRGQRAARLARAMLDSKRALVSSESASLHRIVSEAPPATSRRTPPSGRCCSPSDGGPSSDTTAVEDVLLSEGLDAAFRLLSELEPSSTSPFALLLEVAIERGDEALVVEIGSLIRRRGLVLDAETFATLIEARLMANQPERATATCLHALDQGIVPARRSLTKLIQTLAYADQTSAAIALCARLRSKGARLSSRSPAAEALIRAAARSASAPFEAVAVMHELSAHQALASESNQPNGRTPNVAWRDAAGQEGVLDPAALGRELAGGQLLFSASIHHGAMLMQCLREGNLGGARAVTMYTMETGALMPAYAMGAMIGAELDARQYLAARRLLQEAERRGFWRLRQRGISPQSKGSEKAHYEDKDTTSPYLDHLLQDGGLEVTNVASTAASTGSKSSHPPELKPPALRDVIHIDNRANRPTTSSECHLMVNVGQRSTLAHLSSDSDKTMHNLQRRDNEHATDRILTSRRSSESVGRGNVKDPAPMNEGNGNERLPFDTTDGFPLDMLDHMVLDLRGLPEGVARVSTLHFFHQLSQIAEEPMTNTQSMSRQATFKPGPLQAQHYDDQPLRSTHHGLEQGKRLLRERMPQSSAVVSAITNPCASSMPGGNTAFSKPRAFPMWRSDVTRGCMPRSLEIWTDLGGRAEDVRQLCADMNPPVELSVAMSERSSRGRHPQIGRLVASRAAMQRWATQVTRNRQARKRGAQLGLVAVGHNIVWAGALLVAGGAGYLT